MCLAVRPPPLCRSGSPDPDLFVIRRSQTTEGETHIVTMGSAGDRPPRYGEKKRHVTVGRGPVPRRAAIAGETRSDARMASEGPRATGTSRPEVSPTGKRSKYETPSN